MAESSKDRKISVEMGKQSPQEAAPRRPSRLEEVERDVERLFDQFLTGGWRSPFRRDWPRLSWGAEGQTPRIDVVERDDEIVVRAELPGVDKKDLDVSLTDDTVTIKASTRKESQEEKGDYHRREISTGYLSRTISLPAGVNGNACKAEFKDGLLELKIPKQEKAKRIQVDVK